jgi:hypothetical protein
VPNLSKSSRLDDSEAMSVWEYEYDNNETEDLYVTVDLSNIQSRNNDGGPTQALQPLLNSPATLLQSRLRIFNANTRSADAAINLGDGMNGEPAGEMQITGLHTSNPLIMYNGQLLSCQWASTIGTDFFFTKPALEGQSSDKPMRSLPAVDLLGIGSAKLMAKNATLQPRDELYHNAQKTTQHRSADAANGSSNAQPTVEDLQPALGKQLKAPSDFLARLNEAKAKRGDRTRLVVATDADGSHLSAEPVEPSSAEMKLSSAAAEDIAMNDAE